MSLADSSISPVGPVRVLVVDPSPFFCEALCSALAERPGIHIVGWSTDELDAERRASEGEVDIVLTEVELAPGSGLNLARRLRDGVRVVVLTRGDEGSVLLDAAIAGAAGCLSHRLGVDELVREVGRAAAGRFAVDEMRLLETLRRAAARRDGNGHPELEALTTREQEVLRLLVRGLDNAGIGRRLYLSTHTVRTHVQNILRKLRVHSRADAVRLALRAGEAAEDAPVLRIEGPRLGLRMREA